MGADDAQARRRLGGRQAIHLEDWAGDRAKPPDYSPALLGLFAKRIRGLQSLEALKHATSICRRELLPGPTHSPAKLMEIRHADTELNCKFF